MLALLPKTRLLRVLLFLTVFPAMARARSRRTGICLLPEVLRKDGWATTIVPNLTLDVNNMRRNMQQSVGCDA